EQGARELRVRRQAILVRRPDACMDLVSSVARLQVSLGRYRLGQVDARSCGTPGIQLPQRLIGRPASSIQMIDESNDMILHALKAANRHPELDTGLTVLHRSLKYRLATADLVGAQNRERPLHRTRQGGPPAVRALTEQRARRRLDIVETDLGLP